MVDKQSRNPLSPEQATGSVTPSSNQAPSDMPPPPLPGMDPKPRPIPEMPDSSTNCLNSLNYLGTHPDAICPNFVACCCGLQVRTDGDDWYTQIYNGTVRCLQCSFCARCGADGLNNCRQQVSMGGHVLCYRCVKHYGNKKFIEVMPKLGVVCHEKNKKSNNKINSSGSTAMKNQTEQQQKDVEKSEANNIVTSGSNQSNWWQSYQSPECRPVLRYRDYPKPLKYEPELDPTRYQIGFYSATRPNFDRMTCPTCKKAATGKEAYVVPSISLVYHRKCFFCLGCKMRLSAGVKKPGVHFVFCTCTIPMLWCTKPDCTRQRLEHHTAYNCCLEPNHPGGRDQNDTQILSEKNDMAKKGKKTKKQAAKDANLVAPIPKESGNQTAPTTTSSRISGLKSLDQQQFIKLKKTSKVQVKDGRLQLSTASSGTPAPSISSSSSTPQPTTAMAAGLQARGN